MTAREPARRTRMSTILWIAGAGVAMYAAWCLLLFLNQSSQVYVPDRIVSATPADIGLAFEDLRIDTPDGETLSAWYVPAGEEPNGLTVFLCHGNGGDMGDRIDSIANFHRMGFNVMLFEYRGYGTSTGRPTEEGTYLDAKVCWEHMIRTRNIDPNSVVLVGRSLGGAVAAHLALRVDPLLLVIEWAFTSVPDLGAELYPFLPVRLLCRFRYATVAHVARVRCPVLVTHSRQDSTIPFQHGERIFAAAPEPKRFLGLAGPHAQEGVDSCARSRKALSEFLGAIRTTERRVRTR